MQQNQINRSWSKDSLLYLCEVHPYARTKLLFTEELGYFRTFAPYLTERTFKDSYLLVTTVRGSGNLYYENETYRLKKGDTFLIDCRNYHKYWSDYDEDWSFYWAHINGIPMGCYEDLLQKYCIVTESENSILQYWEGIIQAEQRDGDTLQKKIEQHRILSQILSHLLGRHASRISQYGTMPNYLVDALLLYEENFRQQISLEEIERKLNVSQYTISKQFKVYFQMTPHQYLTNLRLQEAEKLLIDTNLSVNEVAQSVGLSHTSHFINVFKRKFNGLTPASYRQIYFRNTKEEKGS